MDHDVIEVRSYLVQQGALVSLGSFAGPIADEDYVEGALELSIDRHPLLTRDMVDYIDQLWSYLIDGIEEIAAGREWSTYYPDTAIKITLRPTGQRVTVVVERKKGVTEATTTVTELRRALIPAAIAFIEKLLPYMPRHQQENQRVLARLRQLGIP